MKKMIFLLIILTVASIIPLQSNAEEKVVEELKVMSEKFVDMLSMENRTTLKEIAGMLTNDIVQSSSSGKVLVGIKDNMVFYTVGVMEVDSLFSEFDANYDIESIKVFANTAQVFGTLKFTGKLKKDDKSFEREIRESLLFLKTSNGWKITHEHSTRLN